MNPLAIAADDDYAFVSMKLRRRRLDELIWQAHETYERAVAEHITGEGKEHAATFLLFSGGNDSTVLAHLFHQIATHAVHANTGIGIEQTRQFVRSACAGWGLPLIEEHPPAGSTYDEMVCEQGFPGPAHHWKMYQRLKERALRAAKAQVLDNPRRQRVVFLAGRRRAESQRRTYREIPEVERDRSTVWVSPLVEWTAMDLNTYRMVYPGCPRNEVSDLIHMSGECLCGAFAKPDELDEIGYWFPEVEQRIRDLETRVRAAGIPEPRCRWGWGAYRDRQHGVGQMRTGPLCSSCEVAS